MIAFVPPTLKFQKSIEKWIDQAKKSKRRESRRRIGKVRRELGSRREQFLRRLEIEQLHLYESPDGTKYVLTANQREDSTPLNSRNF